MKKWSMFLCLFALLTACDGGPSTSNSNSNSGASAPTSTSTPASTSTSTPASTSTSTSASTSTSTSASASVSASTSASSSVVDNKDVIAEKVALGVQNKGKVKSGTVTEKDLMMAEEDPEMATSVYNYEFGESAFTYSGEGEFAGGTYVYFLDSNGDVFGVEDSFGSISSPWDLCEENLDGYPFTGIISFDYETSYGAEDLVSDFFAEASTNSNKDAKFVVNDDNYEFSFGIKADSESFVVVDVKFTLSAANALKTVEVRTDSYASESFVDDIELGTVTLKEDAVIDYSMSYSVVQVEGTRDFVSPYDENDFYFSSFDLAFEGAPVTDETVVTVDMGGNASISIVNALPETASMNFDKLSVEVTSGDADGVFASCQSFNNSISIMANAMGDYELTISSKNVTKVVKVKVIEPSLQDLTIYQCNPNGSEGNYMYDMFDSNPVVYCNKSLILTAVAKPSAADGSYEATLITPNDAVTFRSIEIKNNMDRTITAYEFVSTVVGTFSVRFTSTVDPSITKDVDIIVAEVPDVKDIVNGEYVYHTYNGTEFKFEFTPDATGLSGHVVIEDVFNHITENLAYVINGSNIELTPVSGDEVVDDTTSLKLNDKYQLVYSFTDTYEWGETYQRELVLERKTPSLMIIGTYSATLDDMTYEISFDRDGKAYMSYYNEDRSVEVYVNFEYSIAEEVSTNGFVITWLSKSNEEDTVIDVANTDSYLSANYEEVHLTITHNGTSQSVLFEFAEM